jgi:hypothetical protein
LPIVTVAPPAGETQPAAEISVTESPTDPFEPAVNVSLLVPWPDVIVPLETLQSYSLPAWVAADAVTPDWFGLTDAGAEIVGVAGGALTVT